MPVLWIVIDVNEFYPELLTVLLVFFLPNLKLLRGVDVGIVKEYNNLLQCGRGNHLVYHGPRTRSAAAMEKDSRGRRMTMLAPPPRRPHNGVKLQVVWMPILPIEDRKLCTVPDLLLRTEE